jgi:NodT family efflux transporter outer membrane factor (OMF) lipoprotein
MRRPLTGVLLALATAIVAGCLVGPDYVRPPMVTPPTFKELAGWTQAQPRDDALRGAWWEMFGDRQLDALAAEVSVSNQNVAAAEAQFRLARALVREARSAYFPQVSIGAGFTWSRAPSSGGGSSSASSSASPGASTAGGSGGGSGGGTGTSFILRLDVSWEPDLWGRVRRAVESSRASAQASAADLANVQLSLQAELAGDYFQLKSLDAQKRLLDETVAAFERSLELTRNRYAAGVASRADVAQAETQLASTRAQAIDVGVQRAQLEHAVATLTGRPASSFSLAFSPLEAEPPGVPVGLPSELLERRPDVAGVERRIAAANAQIGVAKAAYFPTVTLGASAGFASPDLATWLSWPSRFWAVGPSISQTLFDGGLRRARTDEARAVYEAAIAAYRQTVLGAFQEVEDTLAALRILADEAVTQAEAVRASQEALTIITNQYRAGTVSYLEVVVAQTTALANARTAVDILGRRMAAAVVLVKALGGGWSAGDLPSAREVTRREDETSRREPLPR